MKLLKGLVFSIVALITLVGCGQSSKDTSKETSKLQVVTTFYPMYDFASKVVGDKGEVSMLISGNTEPHDFEPSAKDIAKIQEADVFIYNSKEMETWVSSILENIDREKTIVIEASHSLTLVEGVEEEASDDHDHSHEVDPHVWLSPVLAKEEVSEIVKGIQKSDKKNADYYSERGEQFIEELSKLDEEFELAFKDAKNRDFVTQHSAFGYLAKEYKLHQVAISGISPDQEPNPSDLAKIEDFVKENNVTIIFTEELASTKIAETISDATGAKLVSLNTLEGLSKKDQEAKKDYLSVMRENLAALKQAIH